MWVQIIMAIVNLLIFFFEQWWKNHHPTSPAQARALFVAQVSSIRYFYLGRKRGQIAGIVFDKAMARYDADPPVFNLSDAPLSENDASVLAYKYASGITVDPSEIK